MMISVILMAGSVLVLLLYLLNRFTGGDVPMLRFASLDICSDIRVLTLIGLCLIGTMALALALGWYGIGFVAYVLCAALFILIQEDASKRDESEPRWFTEFRSLLRLIVILSPAVFLIVAMMLAARQGWRPMM